jgi:hypothetical protein
MDGVSVSSPYLPSATQDTTDSFLYDSQTTTDSFLTSPLRQLPPPLLNIHSSRTAQAILSRLYQRVPDQFLSTFAYVATSESPPFTNLSTLVAHWESTDASASVPSHHAQCTHESERP